RCQLCASDARRSACTDMLPGRTVCDDRHRIEVSEIRGEDDVLHIPCIFDLLCLVAYRRNGQGHRTFFFDHKYPFLICRSHFGSTFYPYRHTCNRLAFLAEDTPATLLLCRDRQGLRLCRMTLGCTSFFDDHGFADLLVFEVCMFQ